MIAWKILGSEIRLSNVRYRCLIPALALQREYGIQSRIYSGRQTIDFREKIDLLVFVKAFSRFDLTLARMAKARAIPVVLDLCDNIFAAPKFSTRLSPKDSTAVEMFCEMLKYASAVVVPTQTLANVVEEYLPRGVTLQVIVDGVEREEELKPFEELLELNQRNWFYDHGYSWLLLRALPYLLSQQERNYSKKLQRGFVNCTIRPYKVVYQFLRKYITRGYASLLRQLARLQPNFRRLLEESEELESLEVGVIPRAGGLTPVKLEALHSSEKPSTTVPLKKVLWFGGQGIEGLCGVTDILEIAHALVETNKTTPFELVVASNSDEHFNAHIAKLPLHVTFHEWDVRSIFSLIRSSSVVIVPRKQNQFTACKSANRATMALACGTPVISSWSESVEPLRSCMGIDNWREELEHALASPKTLEEKRQSIEKIIEENYSERIVAQSWRKFCMELVPAGLVTGRLDSVRDRAAPVR